MPSRISSSVRRWKSEVTSSRRPPQYGQRRMSSVSRRIPIAELFEQRSVRAPNRRAAEVLDAEVVPCLLVVYPRDGVVRAHLRPVTAQRSELARRPVAHVDGQG